MSKIFNNPLRVYAVVALLAMIGLLSGLKLPISLFPSSSEPEIWIDIPYGQISMEEFIHSHGRDIESRLRALRTPKAHLVTLESYYHPGRANFRATFSWSSSPTESKIATENVIQTFASKLPPMVSEQIGIYINDENIGFFAASFYSEKRNLQQVHAIVDNILKADLAQVTEASDPEIYNPFEQEIKILLSAEKMASLGVKISHVEQALLLATQGQSAGSLSFAQETFRVTVPRSIESVDDFAQTQITLDNQRLVYLSEIARIDSQTKDNVRIFKTDGAPCVILFSSPKPGGNIKKMSEDIIKVIEKNKPLFPSDIEYKILVDPSEFIRASISNVLQEVFLAALIAVVILFLFIGNFRNVATASIEIPLSMVLAFFLMQLFDMNLNLISLGGLALSAGMNVDASVVVMENIFRHLSLAKSPLNRSEKLALVVQAVKEVRLPILASTFCSLVVFLPLIFTSDLSNALLGDLAKAVVFSHGFSAFVALFLVPTIRLHLMEKNTGSFEAHKAPLDPWMHRLENFYSRSLIFLLQRKRLQYGSFCLLLGTLGLLVVFVLPRLPKEIVGKPDTDWLILQIKTDGNHNVRKIESLGEQTEREVAELLGSQLLYTFTNIQDPNRTHLMARLRDKSQMKEVWKKLEDKFNSTPLVRFHVFPWNPSELPIPDPPQLKIWVRGADEGHKVKLARLLYQELLGHKLYSRVQSDPNLFDRHGVVVTPYPRPYGTQDRQTASVDPPTANELGEMIRVATEGKTIGQIPFGNQLQDITLRYDQKENLNLEDLKFLPVSVGSKVVALQSLARLEFKEVAPQKYHYNGQSIISILGRVDLKNQDQQASFFTQTQNLLSQWAGQEKIAALLGEASFRFMNASEQLDAALKQLGGAIVISLGLVLFTLYLQFGSFLPCLIILVSIPLGAIGVIASLYLFGSTLSLNSGLGVILLNGIAVANSILLVDFILKLKEEGMTTYEAVHEACLLRLRPILITSLTTALGMLPIALGWGDGGKILQPLGITVSCGLWVSTLLTIYVVPALMVAYLQSVEKRSFKKIFALAGPLRLVDNEGIEEP